MQQPDLSTLRVLLIQARDTEDMVRQEQICFQERTRLSADQFTTANVVFDPIDASLLNGMDAVMIGGSGEYSATKDYDWTPALLDLVVTIAERRMPLFGSCWGHQVIARALGGRVINDSARAEFGCIAVRLTDEGQRDPLVQDFPARFLANAGHKDRVIELPAGATELAYSDSQPNQAFRIDDRPIYGTQFHSELDAQRERERLVKYRALYEEELGGDEAFDQILASLAETTEVDHLMYDFLVKFVLRPEPSSS